MSELQYAPSVSDSFLREFSNRSISAFISTIAELLVKMLVNYDC